MSYDDFEHEDKIQNELRTELTKAKQLLKEAVYVLNQVPNNLYKTVYGDKYTYGLCNKIDEFLKEKKEE